MSHATLLKALVLTPKHTHTHRACVQNLQNRCATPSLRQHAYATMRNHMHRTGMPTQLMHSHIHQASTHTPQMRSRMQWINTLTTNSQPPETNQHAYATKTHSLAPASMPTQQMRSRMHRTCMPTQQMRSHMHRAHMPAQQMRSRMHRTNMPTQQMRSHMHRADSLLKNAGATFPPASYFCAVAPL